jgi:hypothetical protein
MSQFVDALIGENVEVAIEYFKALMAESNTGDKKNSGGSIGFIPFNIFFTMDGLSGIKIYNELTFDTSFLPPGYSNTLDFIVTGVDHKLKDEDWETEVRVTLIPKTDDIDGIITGSAPITQQIENYKVPPPNEGGGDGGGDEAGNLTGLNSHPSVSNTPLLKKAVLDQSTYVFDQNGEAQGACARYSYNIAYKIKEHIDSQSSGPIKYGKLVSSGGNADQDGHRAAIKKLGIYDEYYMGEFTGDKLKSESGPIKSSSWNYGDILNYYAPCCSGTSYMHTQIYTGDIWQKGIGANGNQNSGWTTSGKTNYGTFFVYPGDSKVYKIYAYKIKAKYLK